MYNNYSIQLLHRPENELSCLHNPNQVSMETCRISGRMKEDISKVIFTLNIIQHDLPNPQVLLIRQAPSDPNCSMTEQAVHPTRVIQKQPCLMFLALLSTLLPLPLSASHYSPFSLPHPSPPSLTPSPLPSPSLPP